MSIVAIVPPLIDAPLQRPPHLLPVPRDAAGRPWPTELDLRAALPPPEPLEALIAALAAVPAGTVQYLRLRGSADGLLRGLARHGIDAVAEAMPDGTCRLRALAPARSGRTAATMRRAA